MCTVLFPFFTLTKNKYNFDHIFEAKSITFPYPVVLVGLVNTQRMYSTDFGDPLTLLEFHQKGNVLTNVHELKEKCGLSQDDLYSVHLFISDI